MPQQGFKQSLYYVDFFYAGGMPPKGSPRASIFYADDDADAVRFAAGLSIADKKEAMILCRYDTKLMPTVIARYEDIEPAPVPLASAEKQDIGLTMVPNIDTAVNMNLHASRVKKFRKSA